ncbi:MAG: hypothetical protein ACJ788_10500 [Ktedonobacteraceae bacterium]
MQQIPNSGGSYSMRTKRTQPALPGATLPTTALQAASQGYPLQSYEPHAPLKKRPNHLRRALLLLVSTGILLEVLFLACYPLLAALVPHNDAAERALLALLPWRTRLYWTTTFPQLASTVSRLPFFDLATRVGQANFLLCLLVVAFLLTLTAARTGSRIVRERLSPGALRALYVTFLLFTLLFGLTFLFAPAVLSQDIFLYGMYGRLVTVYHVNPYTVTLNSFPHDMLQSGLSQGQTGGNPPGPVWLDLSIPVVLFARSSVANVLLGFRLLGLAAHIVNAMLLWVILAKLKPQARIYATLLYAWNPLPLLLSVASMHLECVLVLFLLLAILFFQRNSPVLAWVLVLLAALMSALCLLFLPLFFRLLVRSAHNLYGFPRALWWLMVACLTAIVLILSYLPYWQGWGINGLLVHLRHVFLQDTAINSLDAALLSLPVKLLPPLAWLAIPHHWTILALVVISLLLLFGIWLTDDNAFVVLFSSWVSLTLLVLLPAYWPWYVILPLALALCSAHNRTILLTLLLAAAALLSCYFWLLPPAWTSQALLTIGIPLLIWGWTLFFTSTWAMIYANNTEQPSRPGRRGFSRPSRTFLSRPSWPSRRR